MTSSPALHALTRRALLRGSALLLAAASLPPASAKPPALPSLRLIGEALLPHRLVFNDTVVGGLSGIDFDPERGLWYLLSDEGSEHSPARFYTARLALDADRLATPELLGVTTLKQADGRPYAGRWLGGQMPDPESMRWRAQTGTLLWTDEGDALRGRGPSLRESRPDGSLVREFALPAMFEPGSGSGPRRNLSFEGLALTPDGRHAWVAMEGALVQDGPEPAVGMAGGPCRFTQFDLQTGQAVRQIAYVPDAIPRAPVPAIAPADNGVSEILMLDAQRMLVLERAYMHGVGNALRLYLIDTREASDTLALPRLQPGNHRAASKALLADFSKLGLSRLDNTEGMAWGPRLPGRDGAPGRRTLVFVSDDNFKSGQITQFAAFEFME